MQEILRMSCSLFWFSDDAWAAIEAHLPKNQPGRRRVDDRRVISGIIHMLKRGGRWADCPFECGPSPTFIIAGTGGAAGASGGANGGKLDRGDRRD